jgi:hypothetical protein
MGMMRPVPYPLTLFGGFSQAGKIGGLSPTAPPICYIINDSITTAVGSRCHSSTTGHTYPVATTHTINFCSRFSPLKILNDDRYPRPVTMRKTIAVVLNRRQATLRVPNYLTNAPGWIGRLGLKNFGVTRLSSYVYLYESSNNVAMYFRAAPEFWPLSSATRSPAVGLLVTPSHTIAPRLSGGMMGGLDVVKR